MSRHRTAWAGRSAPLWLALLIFLPVAPAWPQAPSAIPQYRMHPVAIHPHDAGAFTQGLSFLEGKLIESVGGWGTSALRLNAPETGELLWEHRLAPSLFAEGVAVHGTRIYQLTWRSRTGFIYDRRTLARRGTFSYATEGWGLTTDGHRLIMSDGTAVLRFLDAEALSVTGSLEVRDADGPVDYLNELEYAHGRIYANVWKSDRIAVIDPASGRLTAWLDAAGLYRTHAGVDPPGVLNGIALHPQTGRLWVTGKHWRYIFEIDWQPSSGGID